MERSTSSFVKEKHSRFYQHSIEPAFKILRPISNLAYISKLTKRAVCNQTRQHLLQFDLYPLLQSAYQEYRSTETALLKVTNDILISMNSQRLTPGFS